MKKWALILVVLPILFLPACFTRMGRIHKETRPPKIYPFYFPVGSCINPELAGDYIHEYEITVRYDCYESETPVGGPGTPIESYCEEDIETYSHLKLTSLGKVTYCGDENAIPRNEYKGEFRVNKDTLYFLFPGNRFVTKCIYHYDKIESIFELTEAEDNFMKHARGINLCSGKWEKE